MTPPDSNWVVCAGYPDYEISDSGSIRRIGDSHARWKAGRLKAQFLHHGYKCVKMPGNRSEFVHRLMALSFFGPPEIPGSDVAHADGVRANNSLTNLRWASRKENMADAIIHETSPHGERNGHARLTVESVIELRGLRASYGLTHRQLARRFGISPSHVSGILSGRFWKILGKRKAAA